MEPVEKFLGVCDMCLYLTKKWFEDDLQEPTQALKNAILTRYDGTDLQVNLVCFLVRCKTVGCKQMAVLSDGELCSSRSHTFPEYSQGFC